MSSWVALGCAAAHAGSPAPTSIAQIDLAEPFKTQSPWRFAATQDAADPSVVDAAGSEAPGLVHLCLQPGASAPCDPSLAVVPPGPNPYSTWEPHYLGAATVVYPHGRTAPPLLLLQTASEHSGDGDQAVFTQLLAYRRASDRFETIYGHETGRNNNQEDRFVTAGPLRGGVISAEPTDNAPYGYWITVHTLTPAFTYKQVLRYRSATHYGDGNALPVIDSEMANIEQRLGFWRPGQPPPLPASTPCPKPRVSHLELSCE